ncbi:MAG TPA: hypothetical protein PKW35_14860 [Nannocystaceae bacterium]|nr:hypothetical protein [Nannocystaceae bacterium]
MPGMREVRSNTVVVTALMGLLASVVLALALRRPPEASGPPGAFLLPVLGEGEGPAWTFVLVVDFASAEARQVFRELTRALAEDMPDEAEVLLLHAPSGGCQQAGAFACVAARALVCSDDRPQEVRLRLAGAAFDLLWEHETARSYASLRGQARSLGVDVEALDACVEGAAATRRVQEQAAIAERFGHHGGVGGWMIRRRGVVSQAPFGRFATAATLRRLRECLEEPARCEVTK